MKHPYQRHFAMSLAAVLLLVLSATLANAGDDSHRVSQPLSSDHSHGQQGQLNYLASQIASFTSKEPPRGEGKRPSRTRKPPTPYPVTLETLKERVEAQQLMPSATRDNTIPATPSIDIPESHVAKTESALQPVMNLNTGRISLSESPLYSQAFKSSHTGEGPSLLPLHITSQDAPLRVSTERTPDEIDAGSKRNSKRLRESKGTTNSLLLSKPWMYHKKNVRLNLPLRYVNGLEDAIDYDDRRHARTDVTFLKLMGADRWGLSKWRVFDELKTQPFDILVPPKFDMANNKDWYEALPRHVKDMIAVAKQREASKQFMLKQRLSVPEGKGKEALAEHFNPFSKHIPEGQHSEANFFKRSPIEDGQDAKTTASHIGAPSTYPEEDARRNRALKIVQELREKVGLKRKTGSARWPIFNGYSSAFLHTYRLVPGQSIDSYWFQKMPIKDDNRHSIGIWVAYKTWKEEEARHVVIRYPFRLILNSDRKLKQAADGNWASAGEGRTVAQDAAQGASAPIFEDVKEALEHAREMWEGIGVVKEVLQLSPPYTKGLLRFCVLGLSIEKYLEDKNSAPDLRSHNFWLSESPLQSYAHPRKKARKQLSAKSQEEMAATSLRKQGGVEVIDMPAAVSDKQPRMQALASFVDFSDDDGPSKGWGEAEKDTNVEGEQDSNENEDEQHHEIGKRSLNEEYDDEARPIHADIDLPDIKLTNTFYDVDSALEKLHPQRKYSRNWMLLHLRTIRPYDEWCLKIFLPQPEGGTAVLYTKFYTPVRRRSKRTRLDRRQLGEGEKGDVLPIDSDLGLPDLRDNNVFPSLKAALETVDFQSRYRGLFWSLELIGTSLAYKEFQLKIRLTAFGEPPRYKIMKFYVPNDVDAPSPAPPRKRSLAQKLQKDNECKHSTAEKRGLPFDEDVRPLQLPIYFTLDQAREEARKHWPDLHSIRFLELTRTDVDEGLVFLLEGRNRQGTRTEKRFEFYFQPLQVFNSFQEARAGMRLNDSKYQIMLFQNMHRVQSLDAAGLSGYRYDVVVRIRSNGCTVTIPFDFYIKRQRALPDQASSSTTIPNQIPPIPDSDPWSAGHAQNRRAQSDRLTRLYW